MQIHPGEWYGRTAHYLRNIFHSAVAQLRRLHGVLADDDLAHDIYSMTVDSLGRVVVSGAGYVRILVDEDGDGKAAF